MSERFIESRFAVETDFSGWRLDRSRLAAVTAAVAPDVPILDTSADPLPGDEDNDRPNSAPEAGPAA